MQMSFTQARAFQCLFQYLLLVFLTSFIITAYCIENNNSYYAIVIDAGSTGSRAFIFHLSEVESCNIDSTICEKSRSLTSTKGKKIQPGLSDLMSIVHDQNSITEYFLPIFIDASNIIPAEFHKLTRVIIKGTAGMRLLPEVEQQLMWEQVYHGLNNHPDNPFTINLDDLGTISGHLEAYYAVLSSNYIAGAIDANLKPVPGVPFVGALDMGGSSTQLIFYTGDEHNRIISPENFWSHSWLNFGVEKVREKVQEVILSKFAHENLTVDINENEDLKIIVDNPCTFPGYDEEISPTIVLRGTGKSFDCVNLIREVVWPSQSCESQPCYIDGIEHPPIRGHFYGMSVYFFAIDCVRELGSTKLHSWPTPTIDELEEAIHDFCAIPWDEVKVNMLGRKHKYTMDYKLPHRCLEALYIALLLEEGFGFDGSHRNITIALEVKGKEVEWTLGYALAELYTSNQSKNSDEHDRINQKDIAEYDVVNTEEEITVESNESIENAVISDSSDELVSELISGINRNENDEYSEATSENIDVRDSSDSLPLDSINFSDVIVNDNKSIEETIVNNEQISDLELNAQQMSTFSGDENIGSFKIKTVEKTYRISNLSIEDDGNYDNNAQAVVDEHETTELIDSLHTVSEITQIENKDYFLNDKNNEDTLLDNNSQINDVIVDDFQFISENNNSQINEDIIVDDFQIISEKNNSQISEDIIVDDFQVGSESNDGHINSKINEDISVGSFITDETIGFGDKNILSTDVGTIEKKKIHVADVDVTANTDSLVEIENELVEKQDKIENGFVNNEHSVNNVNDILETENSSNVDVISSDNSSTIIEKSVDHENSEIFSSEDDQEFSDENQNKIIYSDNIIHTNEHLSNITSMKSTDELEEVVNVINQNDDIFERSSESSEIFEESNNNHLETLNIDKKEKNIKKRIVFVLTPIFDSFKRIFTILKKVLSLFGLIKF